jgi:hypothetical protein
MPRLIPSSDASGFWHDTQRVESLYRGQILLPTPELKVAYSAPTHSLFWQRLTVRGDTLRKGVVVSCSREFHHSVAPHSNCWIVFFSAIRKMEQSTSRPAIPVAAHLMLSLGESDFDRRSEDFGLVIAPDVERAIEGADAVVIVSRRRGAVANERSCKLALEQAPVGSACFVHGVLANSS